MVIALLAGCLLLSDAQVDSMLGQDVVDSGVDADGDGYDAGVDCDDGDAEVNPGAEEICDPNNVDENCDGFDNTVDAPGCTLWYSDQDGDDFGAGEAVCQCHESADKLVDNDDDCDDGDAEVNPEAVEVCKNGKDDDCSGTESACILADDAAVGDADAVILGTGFHEHTGAAVVVGRVDDDATPDLVIGAPGLTDGAGAAYVFLAATAVLGGTIVDRDAAHQCGSADTQAGATVAVANLDATAEAELLIGAPGYGEGDASNSGGVYLIPGAPDPQPSTLDAPWFSGAAGDEAASSLGTADVNGDGSDDLLVGSSPPSGGTAWLFFSSPTLTSTPSATFVDTDTGSGGTNVSGAGDLDGDGLDEVAIGAPLLSPSGSVTVIPGDEAPPSGSLSDLGHTFTGRYDGDEAGFAAAAAGDVNHDGHADLLITAPTSTCYSRADGAAYLVPGAAAWAPADGEIRSIAGVQRYCGQTSDQNVGTSVASGGDVDGDGIDDFLIGAKGVETTDSEGAVYLVYGSAAPVGGIPAEGASGPGFIGASGDVLGARNSLAAGDLNDDGYSDLVLGAYLHTGTAADDPDFAGAVYLFFGTGL